MIECEWLCIKESGRAATTKIKLLTPYLLKAEINVCNNCLACFAESEYIIIETNLN